MRKHLMAGLCGSASLLAVSHAQAQTASAPGALRTEERGQTLETIIVTARKRTESLQDVPVAVVAITQASLKNNLSSDLSKIGELAPQVSIGRSVTGTGAVITIRGISSSAADSGLDQSVAIDIDNMALSRGRIIQSAMFDLQQVAVLEGPQALFFGKNSPAGVISLQTADPATTFGGNGAIGYEFNAKEIYAQGAVSIPINDQLRMRLAAHYSHMQGWIHNNAQAGPNPFAPNAPLPGPLQGRTDPRGSDAAARLTVLWEPSSDFTAKLKVTVDREHVNSNAAQEEAYCIPPTTVPDELGVPMTNADCRADRQKAENSLPALFAAHYPYGNNGVPFQRSDLELASLTLNKTVGSVTLTSTTGYYDQFHRGSHIGDYSPFVLIYDSERERYRMFNQEFRMNTEFSGPLNVMVGGYYEHSSRRWLNAPDLFNVQNPLTGDYTSTINTADNKTNSWSVFGQLRWKIMPNLELDGGARYSRDRKTAALENVINNPAGPLFAAFYPAGVPINSEFVGHNLSPEVTLTWKPEPNQTLYAGYKTGYKAGGISNAGLLIVGSTPDNVKFGSEKVKGFEAGYKADLLDRSLRIDVTVYRYKYTGLQVTAFDNVNFRYSIRNAASSRTSGVTASATWLASRELSLNATLGYNKAHFLSFPNAQCYSGQTAAQGCVGGAQDLTGRPLIRAPKLTYSLGADYTKDIGGSWKADLSASASHSSSYQSADDYGPGGFQKAFWRLNAAVHVGPQDDSWSFSVIGRNLTNSYYKVVTFGWSGTNNPNEYASFFNRPREVAVEVSHQF
jgi:outer membrane receptor protein involved in Fe transport